MELILKQDVENVGFKDDVVTVKNGYGRNFLIPQGVAQMATPSAKKVLAENLKQRAYKEQKMVDDANAMSATLMALEIKISSKAGTGDKLFGSVNNANITEALAALGHDVEKKFITVAGGNIKRTGKYTAKVRLHRSVVIDLPFEVVGTK